MQLITNTHDIATLAKLDCELLTKDIEGLFQLLDRHQKVTLSDNLIQENIVDSNNLLDYSQDLLQETRDIILVNAPAIQNDLIVTAKTMTG